MSYYDVDSILTSAQKVPCTFQFDIPGLGFLDNSSHALKRGTKLDLPLWLAEPLTFNSVSGTPIVNLELPPSLYPQVISALKASPKNVDLRAQAQHFYALAARMLEIFGDEEGEGEELGAVLYETFRSRAVEIGDHAANAGGANRGAGGVGVGTEGVEFLRGLEEDERRLFRGSHESAKATKAWMAEVKKSA